MNSKSITHKFKIGEDSYYVTAVIENKQIKRVMLKTLSGQSGCDWTGEAITAMIRAYGIRIAVARMKYHKFEPSGTTGSDIRRIAQSIPDYIGHWLEHINKEIKENKNEEPEEREGCTESIAARNSTS